MARYWIFDADACTFERCDQQSATEADVPVIVNDGDILSFSSAVSAYAHDVGLSFEGTGNGSGDSAWSAYGLNPVAVPLPGAVWLFASALLGQAGIRRHRRSLAV